jgi:hypothetical protein
MNKTCKDCKYWEPLNHEPIQGECRKNAPMTGKYGPSWPMVASSAWCGQLKDISTKPKYHDIIRSRYAAIANYQLQPQIQLNPTTTSGDINF